jgi:hypothetical protein
MGFCLLDLLNIIFVISQGFMFVLFSCIMGGRQVCLQTMSGISLVGTIGSFVSE